MAGALSSAHAFEHGHRRNGDSNLDTHLTIPGQPDSSSWPVRRTLKNLGEIN
jgi:hypothetical protein